jgi:hypothetical protein
MTNLVLKESESLQTFQDKAPDRPVPDRDSTAPRKRRATGPRTEQGRKRASRNAIAHGIFSSVVVLPGEPEKLYKKLLRELVAAWQPVGGFEKLLVEKLAVCAWQLRRCLAVEGAEIRLSTEFYARDREAQQAHEASLLALLSELESQIKKNRFDMERDTQLLATAYRGGLDNCKGLLLSYKQWSEASNLSQAERICNGYATPDECVEEFLSDLAEELGRLRTSGAETARLKRERVTLEVTMRALPRPERAELLLKYKSVIERDFERTLSQLERIQRQRRGQPQAPRIDVTIATE